MVSSISFVIPVFNEEESLEELYSRIAFNAESICEKFEVIFIDDGSTDNSWNVVKSLALQHSGSIKGIKFRRNSGKARALAAGFEEASGEIVFTLDADLQDDPKEIPRFIQKLEEGFDLISGWKQVRHDPWHKVLPSRVFNKMLSTMVGVDLHDHNCGFKCYRSAVIKDLSLYGEMHRMIPSLASIKGYRSSEIVVEHHPRKYGYSKYGMKRFLRGFMDMLTVSFLKNYKERPSHLMAGVAILSGILGVSLLVVSLVVSYYLQASPSLLLTVAQALLSAVLPILGIGLISELIISRRTEDDKKLHVSERINKTEVQVVNKNFSYLYPEKVSKKLDQKTMPFKARALVVDDDPKIRRLMEFELTELGFEVDQAVDGLDALDKITEETSVVLLDLMMPNKDGLECLKEFQACNANVQVIMVSAHGQISQAVQAMKNGAFDYIQKPFSPERIEEVVMRALRAQQIESEYRELHA